VFRVLQPGDNPDVVVQGALAAVGCDRIPAPVGWLEGTWPAAGAGGPVHGHLAVASEFLVGAQDAWREATEALAEDRDFSAQARALGEATGEVHRALAEAMPTREVTAADRAALATGLRDRAAWALLSAPVLSSEEDALQARLDTADAVMAGDDAPVLQRIHGDYHLGQVLHVTGRGWMLLDFEGEPLRPLAERSLPDLALRDVAGMLRSFDYAAASAPPERAEAARSWGEAARAAFCEGYAAATGADPRAQGQLLDALELDKALYEVVYETRNRPTWVPVPLGAVRRLLAG
jgi:predicted trehalose synthase